MHPWYSMIVDPPGETVEWCLQSIRDESASNIGLPGAQETFDLTEALLNNYTGVDLEADRDRVKAAYAFTLDVDFLAASEELVAIG